MAGLLVTVIEQSAHVGGVERLGQLHREVGSDVGEFIVRPSRRQVSNTGSLRHSIAALLRLRDNNMLSLGEEFRREERRKLVFRGNKERGGTSVRRYARNAGRELPEVAAPTAIREGIAQAPLATAGPSILNLIQPFRTFYDSR